MPLKNDILGLLEKERGKIISGTALAEKFGVSRNAVWKALNALKEEGHLIETVGRKGHRLSEESDCLSEEAIRAALGGRLSGLKIVVCGEVSSTNDEAKKLLADDPKAKAVIVADKQLRGRGRFGREFYSPAGTGLYLSAVIHPDKPFAEAVLYTAAAAVGATRAIKKTAGTEAQIKWINDLYIGGRKVCGILTEADTDFETGRVRSMVIGIGINVTTDDFPDDIKDKAVSLGRRISRCRLAAELIAELYTLTENESNFMDEYRSRCFIIGRDITFSDGRKIYRGKCAGIGDGCELILETDKGTISFPHGEITDF